MDDGKMYIMCSFLTWMTRVVIPLLIIGTLLAPHYRTGWGHFSAKHVSRFLEQ